jgi:hypothetical protein
MSPEPSLFSGTCDAIWTVWRTWLFGPTRIVEYSGSLSAAGSRFSLRRNRRGGTADHIEARLLLVGQ